MPSWTTRPRRAQEAGEDIDHRFVTEEQFQDLEQSGYFLEVVEMFGFRYGLPPISPSDKIPAILVRAPLLGMVSTHFPDHVVYQIESSLDAVRERLRERQGSRREIEERLQSYADELTLGRALCHRRFDTSEDQPVELIDTVERAIAEDFRMTAANVYGTDATSHRLEGP